MTQRPRRAGSTPAERRQRAARADALLRVSSLVEDSLISPAAEKANNLAPAAAVIADTESIVHRSAPVEAPLAALGFPATEDTAEVDVEVDVGATLALRDALAASDARIKPPGIAATSEAPGVAASAATGHADPARTAEELQQQNQEALQRHRDDVQQRRAPEDAQKKTEAMKKKAVEEEEEAQSASTPEAAASAVDRPAAQPSGGIIAEELGPDGRLGAGPAKYPSAARRYPDDYPALLAAWQAEGGPAIGGVLKEVAADAVACRRHQLYPGCVARAEGLVNAIQKNGLKCVLESWNAKDERWKVLFYGDKKSSHVRPQNLTPVEDTPGSPRSAETAAGGEHDETLGGAHSPDSLGSLSEVPTELCQPFTPHAKVSMQ